MDMAEQRIRWSIDSMVLRDASLFSFGWCAYALVPIVRLAVLLDYADGTQEVVPARYGVNRDDVTASFPQLTSACGFFVHATLSSEQAVTAVWLEVHRADGSHEKLSCPLPEQTHAGPMPGQRPPSLPWTTLVKDSFRAFWMLLRGDWGAVWRGAKQRYDWLRAGSADDVTLRKLFAGLSAGAVLIVDHSLGGGANQFRAGRVRLHTEAGRDVVVWTFVPYLLRHEISITSGAGGSERKLQLAWEAWELLLASRKVTDVEFNNCVGYPRQEEVPAMLAAFRQVGGARLRVFLHDFHMVCPSHFLLNDEGKFCGVPDIEQCRKCLPRINDGLAGLFAARDIDLWRLRWGEMLQVADEVVHFSHSSRDLLTRAYPILRDDQWVLRPHQVAAAKSSFNYPRGETGMRVAVVGHISRHKGSTVVLDLIRQARRQKVDLQVVVIGTLDAVDDAEQVLQTGTYQPEDLAELLAQHRVHMALMPSICPETFSYVTHELMQIGVPLISFKIGAQAEAVSAYQRGRVTEMGSAQELLQQIQEFKTELDSRRLP
jgi:glycosyltransferase involved in cell wall biosynthesis